MVALIIIIPISSKPSTALRSRFYDPPLIQAWRAPSGSCQQKAAWLTSEQGFLTSVLLTLGPNHFLRWGPSCAPASFGGIPGLYPVDPVASLSLPVVTTKYVSDIARCPWGDKIPHPSPPPVEKTCSGLSVFLQRFRLLSKVSWRSDIVIQAI